MSCPCRTFTCQCICQIERLNTGCSRLRKLTITTYVINVVQPNQRFPSQLIKFQSDAWANIVPQLSFKCSNHQLQPNVNAFSWQYLFQDFQYSPEGDFAYRIRSKNAMGSSKYPDEIFEMGWILKRPFLGVPVLYNNHGNETPFL